MTTALAVFIAAFVVALFAVPVAKRIALSLRIVDAPDKQRKLHGRIVPLTGGLTLLMTLPLVVLIGVSQSGLYSETIRHRPTK